MTGRTGQILGNYRIEEQLGTGGMGIVYRGVHVHLGRPAAVKILHAHLAAMSGFQARFLQEARASASLDHPHIVQVYDFGEQDDLYYLVMELIVDGSLRDVLGEASKHPDRWRAWRLNDGLDLVRQAADGLAAAHTVGMIHRDIKPDNLLVKHGIDTGTGKDVYTVKIADFGLARLAEGTHLTATGAMLGTPAYMSPEQVQGMELDGRSDIYSLGLILYEVATGRLPFEAKTPTEAIFKHVYTEPVSPRYYEPEISNELESVILRCLAKQPAERFPNAGELARALQHVLHRPATAPSESQSTEPPRTLSPDLAPRDMLGMRLNRYELLELLPAGGMAHVFRARHVTLDRDVAIKILRPEYAADPNFVQRFVKEARIAAPLQHGNIVEIFDTGMVNGLYYIAMEYVDGQSARQLLDIRRPSVGEVVGWVTQIASALDYAHAHGVIHRDIKPANIMLQPDGQALLLDFGIAKLSEEIALGQSFANLTVAGMVIGTPAYLAPERATDAPITPQADIYSLGCVAYELLTGSPPFSGGNFAALVESHRSQHARPAHELNSALSPDVSAVLTHAMAKEPEERFPTAQAFADALAAAAGYVAYATVPVDVMQPLSQPTPAPSVPPTIPPAAPPPARTGAAAGGEGWFQWWYGALAGVAVLAVILGAFLLSGGLGGDDDATATPTNQSGLFTATSGDVENPTATEDPEAATATGQVIIDETTATDESTASPTATQTAAPPQPPVERIAWVAGRIGDPDVPEIFIANVDGGDEVHLSTVIEDPASAWGPAWYPDGHSFAFISNQAGNDDIWAVDTGGENLRQITTDLAADQYPAWSPTGLQLAFQSMREGNWEIYTANADGSAQRNITNNPGVDWGPNWSPDGQWIAFVSNRDGTDDVWMVRPDGSEARNITLSPDLEANPVWSPDGQWIAFGRNTDGNSDIWIMRPDGSEQRAVTAGDAFDSNPSWSPSGKQIVFASERGGDRDVYMLDVETAAVTQFTTDPFYDGSPAWSPVPPRGENPIDAVESWVAYDGAGELDQLAQFDLAVIDAQPDRNYTAEEIEELKSNGTIVLSTLNVGACESFRPYFAMCEAKLEEAVPDVAGEYYIDITHPDMQAALLAYADELWHTGVSGFYLTNVDVGWTRERPELTDSVIAFVSALRDRYPDRIIVLESREPDLFRLFDAAGRPVHWLVDGESFPVLSRGWRHDFAPMFDEDRALLAQRLEILQAQRLTIFTLDWAADDGSACAAYGFSVDQGFLGYVATNGELSEVATWSCLGP